MAAERSEAILGINVPNAISIGIMLAFWAVVYFAVRKAVGGPKLPPIATSGVFSS